MDASQALVELAELSSQIKAAVVLDGDGTVAAATPGAADAETLGRAALELLSAASDLGSSRTVTRVEVELEEGGIFVLREGDRTIAAATGAQPTAGLVVYDLRTCLQSIDEVKPAKKRSRRAKAAE